MKVRTLEEEAADRQLRKVAGELAHYKKMSVTDLITQCNEAVGKMGVGNPHKALVFNCAAALRQLVDRLSALENPQDVPETEAVQ